MQWNLRVQIVPKLFLGDGPTYLCPDYIIMTYLETQQIKIKNKSY